MDEIYVCYHIRRAREYESLPGIIYLKNNRNVCFFDDEKNCFLDTNLEKMSIDKKIIIPYSYCEETMIPVIKAQGGIIPCEIDNYSTVHKWLLFYKPERKMQLIKGKDLLDPACLDIIEEEYGSEIFFKTVEKAYTDIVKIEYLRDAKSLIHVALSLHPDDEFIISEVLDLLTDNISSKEYRVFVYNNKVLNISRYTEFTLHQIDEKILTKAEKVIEEMKGKSFPSAYVVDLCEYEDKDGEDKIDVVEFNPFYSSGRYLYNSIDYMPADDILHKDIFNVAIERRNLVDLCRTPNAKYKNIIRASKYYGNPGSFANDLKKLNDYNSIFGSDIELGKNVDDVLETFYQDKEIEKSPQVDNNSIITKMRMEWKIYQEESVIENKQHFIENIKLNQCPFGPEYLTSSGIIPDEEKEIPKTVTINLDVLKKYQKEINSEHQLQKVLKKKITKF